MHKIHNTKAFVLKSIPIREADKLITFFTEEFGLIRVIAPGIRYEKSKLRFSVQDFSETQISLVQGKGMWRLTNASSIQNLYHEVSKEKLLVVARIFSLLNKLLDEEKNEELFKIVENGVRFLAGAKIDSESLLDIESVLVLRILNNLGYVGDNKNLEFFVMNNDMNEKVVEGIKKEREETLKEINRALASF